MSNSRTWIKRLVSPVIRKNVFLFLNRLKINIIDPLLFPERRIAREKFLRCEEKNPFLELQIPVAKFPQDVQQLLSIWTDPGWTQDQYLLIFDEAGIIEPTSGWGMQGKQLIYSSLGFARAPYVHKPELFRSKRRVVKLKNVMSLRDTGEENYFHFFNDVIPKIYFARDNGVDLANYHLVVSSKLAERDYFKQTVSLAPFAGLQWHVQNDEVISFERAIFCKPFTHTKSYIGQTADLLISKFGNHVSPQVQDRLFITRPEHSLRFIENFNEIEEVLKQHRFAIVDPALMSFAEQVSLFTRARYLIGVHGAGMTNMIFRKDQDTGVLEIVQPFDYIPFHYMMLAHQFGFDYNVLVGTKGKRWAEGGFRVDPAKFESMVKLLVAR